LTGITNTGFAGPDALKGKCRKEKFKNNVRGSVAESANQQDTGLMRGTFKAAFQVCQKTLYYRWGGSIVNTSWPTTAKNSTSEPTTMLYRKVKLPVQPGTQKTDHG